MCYGECFGREGLRVAGERGGRLFQKRFSADRRDKRDYQVHLRGGKAIEAVCFPIAGDRRPASVR